MGFRLPYLSSRNVGAKLPNGNITLMTPPLFLLSAYFLHFGMSWEVPVAVIGLLQEDREASRDKHGRCSWKEKAYTEED